MVDVDSKNYEITAEERELLKTIWGQRELGVRLPLAPCWRLDTLEQNLEYLKNNLFPFLQLINTTVNFSINNEVKLLRATNGWVIHDYGDAISSCAPNEEIYKLLEAKPNAANSKELLSSVNETNETDGEDGTDGGDGGDFAGGIIKQQADTAFLMLELAKQKGWAAAELVAGTKNMQRYAWIAAKLLNYKLSNYKPAEEDFKCLEHVKNLKQAVTSRPKIVRETLVRGFQAPKYD
jgi:hypothetical protein